LSEESVLVATARLDDAMRRQVAEACEHARVRPCFWGPAGPEGSGAPQNPSLLIAALPPGQRAIPEEVSVLATQTFQSLPLLLLCGEPLVRHSVTLQGGRVTLLGQPLTREKISARIRTAVTGPGASGAESAMGAGDQNGVRVHEMRGREWWAGAVACDPLRAGRGPALGDALPSLTKLGRHGIAGLVPLDLAAPLPSAVLRQAGQDLAAGLPAERALATLETQVGASTAAAWFSPASGQWSLFAPRPELEMWLVSPLRLPNLCRVSPSGPTSAWRFLPAASGDVLLLALGSLRSLVRDASARAELGRAAEGGGPGLLDHLEAVLSARPEAASALVVELR
jgi:hypothetical protein